MPPAKSERLRTCTLFKLNESEVRLLRALNCTRSRNGPVTEGGALKLFEKVKRLALGSFTDTGPWMIWLGACAAAGRAPATSTKPSSKQPSARSALRTTDANPLPLCIATDLHQPVTFPAPVSSRYSVRASLSMLPRLARRAFGPRLASRPAAAPCRISSPGSAPTAEPRWRPGQSATAPASLRARMCSSIEDPDSDVSGGRKIWRDNYGVSRSKRQRRNVHGTSARPEPRGTGEEGTVGGAYLHTAAHAAAVGQTHAAQFDTQVLACRAAEGRPCKLVAIDDADGKRSTDRERIVYVLPQGQLHSALSTAIRRDHHRVVAARERDTHAGSGCGREALDRNTHAIGVAEHLQRARRKSTDLRQIHAKVLPRGCRKTHTHKLIRVDNRDVLGLREFKRAGNVVPQRDRRLATCAAIWSNEHGVGAAGERATAERAYAETRTGPGRDDPPIDLYAVGVADFHNAAAREAHAAKV